MANTHDVKITVVKQEGFCGIDHKEGDTFMMAGSVTPQGICLAAFHGLLPSIRVLQMGGDFPWEEEGKCHVTCSDGENPVTFLLERV